MHSPSINAPSATQAEPSDSLLRLIADSVPALMAYFELPSLLCRFANQGYAAYHGQTPESMLNRSVEEAIGTRAWLAIAPYVERSKRGERVDGVCEVRRDRCRVGEQGYALAGQRLAQGGIGKQAVKTEDNGHGGLSGK